MSFVDVARYGCQGSPCVGCVGTLMAWYEWRDDFRTFRVDPIAEFQVLEAECEEIARISLQQILSQNELAWASPQ
ncbi:hypothetical protein [Saccharospirillum alexandrii]|uniref:hypothetical protein n=1 Tax=Saccharospirillum alexandrii TaxID=2448477 RepID=UPI000FDB1158|nr:hypothetical protein [Saccharospirillum alexandrii]